MNTCQPCGESNCVFCSESEELREELSDKDKKIEQLRNVLKEICLGWNESCEKTCDRFGHDENCRGLSIAAAKKSMRLENEQLKAAVRDFDLFKKAYENQQAHKEDQYEVELFKSYLKLKPYADLITKINEVEK